MSPYLLALAATLIGQSNLADIWSICHRRASVRAEPRAFSKRIACLKRAVRVRVVGTSTRGRWLKVSGWIGPADDGAALAIIPFSSPTAPQEGGPNAVPYAWVSRLAARQNREPSGPRCKVYTFNDLRAARLSVGAAIRGFDRDQETFNEKMRDLDRAIVQAFVLTKANAAMAKWVSKVKLTPAGYQTFRETRRPETTGSDVRVDGEEDLPDLGADVLDAACELSVADISADLVDDMVSDIVTDRSGSEHRRPVINPPVNVYVNMVAALLGEFSSRYDILYRVVVVEDRAPNSKSWPGGYIVITSGLLALCADEAELAAALAHEIAHVSRDHGLMQPRREDEELKTPGRTHAFVELEELVDGFFKTRAISSDWYAFRGLMGFADRCRAATYGKQRRLAEELEADKYALVYLARSGYHPHALLRLVERLPDPDPRFTVLHMTHYAPRAERLKHIQDCLADAALSLDLPKTDIDRDRAEEYCRMVKTRLTEWKRKR